MQVNTYELCVQFLEREIAPNIRAEIKERGLAEREVMCAAWMLYTNPAGSKYAADAMVCACDILMRLKPISECVKEVLRIGALNGHGPTLRLFE